jgi:hypothetical protein
MRQELRRRTPDHHAHTGHPATRRAPHSPRRVIPVALFMGVLLLFGVAVAQAQPANDDIANATPITTLPFTDGPVDTTLVTTTSLGWTCCVTQARFLVRPQLLIRL